MQTPLQLATEMGHNQICRLLLRTGATSSASPETSQSLKSEAIHVAAKSSLASIANMIARTARLDYPALLVQGTRALFNSPDK